MNDLRKAAEMALEALENGANFIPVKTGLERETNNAIQALRQALAQPEQEPEWVATIGNWGKVQWREDVFPHLGAKLYSAPPQEALRQALAEPEQRMSVEGSGKLTTKPYPDSYESEQEFRQALAHEALDRMVAENQRLGLYDDLQPAIDKGTKAWADVPNASQWVEELRGNDTPEVTPEVPCKSDVDNSAPEAEDVHGNVDNVNINDKRVHKIEKSVHEWVGLTDKEWYMIWRYSTNLKNAIEEKLREKNDRNFY